MVRGIGHFDRIVCFFLGVVGGARFFSSFRSFSSSISFLVIYWILVLVCWF